MRTAADRAELRAKRGEPAIVVNYSGTAAALRALGHVGEVYIDKAPVVRWRFPATAAADHERVSREMRRAAAREVRPLARGAARQPAVTPRASRGHRNPEVHNHDVRT